MRGHVARPLRLFLAACLLPAVCQASLSAQTVDQQAQTVDQQGREVVERSVAFLTREVAAWRGGNGCFSCHNNGDAARALYRAVQLGRPVAMEKLLETSRWLAQPSRWEHNGGEGEFNDQRLAALQFGSALAEATAAKAVGQPGPLDAAARKVAAAQEPDGSWKYEAAGSLGSPITYGRCLATAQALQLLRRADSRRYAEPARRAVAWLEQNRPRNVLDAAATVLGLAGQEGEVAAAQRRHCLQLIRTGEYRSGGWGPYVTSAPEVFDTSLVLLALAALRREGIADERIGWLITSGRRYLIEAQQEDGSWPETTRPAGATSYAHRLSTAGWATLALLETEPRAASGTR